MERDISLTSKIALIERELTALKMKQRAGQDVNAVHEATTAGSYDYQWNKPIAYFDTIQRFYKFVANTQEYPLVKIVMNITDVTSGNNTDPEKLRVSIQDISTLAGFNSKTKVFVVELSARRWTLTPPPAITDSIRFKGYAFASDTGTLTYHDSMPT